MNFVRYLLERTRDPEKLFIMGDHGTLSYAEFLQKVEDVTSVLYNQFGTMKKILLMADNTPFFIICYLSIIYSGNTAVLVETRISKTDLTQIIETGSLSGALVQNKYCHYFEDSTFNIMNEAILKESGDKEFFLHPPAMHDDDNAVIIFTSGSTDWMKQTGCVLHSPSSTVMVLLCFTRTSVPEEVLF
jgi:long-chain acyl-CoA synthetase